MARVDIEFLTECSTDDSSRVSADIFTGNHVLLCLLYKHNGPLLTRKVDFIDDDDPRIKMRKCVSIRLKIKKTPRIITKTTVGVIFNIQKLSVIDFVLTDTRNLPGKRPKSACGKSSNCRFLFSAARISITKAAEYVTLGFFSYFGFLPVLRKF